MPGYETMRSFEVSREDEELVSDFKLDIVNEEFKTINLLSDNKKFFDLDNFKNLKLEEEKIQAEARESLMRSGVHMQSKNTPSIRLSVDNNFPNEDSYLFQSKKVISSNKHPFTRKLTSTTPQAGIDRRTTMGQMSQSRALEEFQLLLKSRKREPEKFGGKDNIIRTPRKRAKSEEKVAHKQTPQRSSTCGKAQETYEYYQSRYYFLMDNVLYKFDFFSDEGLKQRMVEDKIACEEKLEFFEKTERDKKQFLNDRKIKTGRVFTKLWRNKIVGIKAKSAYADFLSYTLRAVIIKGGDDLRQEIFAMQLIKKFHQIFKEENTGLFLRPYEIVVTSASAGFLEFLTDTVPISSLKKKYDSELSLLEIYADVFRDNFEFARKNFIESLAGYSLLCFLLQIKDRHNGNIMVGSEGHIMHIDFGFLISISPGNITFENAPFKLTCVILLGVPRAHRGRRFRSLRVLREPALQGHDSPQQANQRDHRHDARYEFQELAALLRELQLPEIRRPL